MAASDGGHVSELRRALLGGWSFQPIRSPSPRRGGSTSGGRWRLTRYYCDAGAGGIAVGVHTTQFAIRDPGVQLAAPRCSSWRIRTVRRLVRQPRAAPDHDCGRVRADGTSAARSRARGVARVRRGVAEPGGPARRRTTRRVLDHCRRVADIIPVMGFYLQPAVGGRVLDRAFWRGFLEIERVVAIKVAPFDRYRTLDVVMALAESGRRDVALVHGERRCDRRRSADAISLGGNARASLVIFRAVCSANGPCGRGVRSTC